MKKFICLSALLVLSRYADIYTTYLSTPDLKTEANPLVSVVGLGWTGLIFAQAILLSLFIYWLWVYCFKKVAVAPFTKTLPLKQFISLFYFTNTTSFFKLLYKFPTNKNSLPYSLGYIATYSLIISSIIISVSTWFVVVNDSYKNFYVANDGWKYLYAVHIGLIFLISWIFFKREFKRRSVV